MRIKVMRLLQVSLLAMATVGLMATGAQADLVFFDSGDNLPAGNPSTEAAFLASEFGINTTALQSLTADGTVGGITVDGIDATSATVSWDLTSTGLELNWVLVVDGGTAGPGSTKLFNLYSVTADQVITSNGDQSVICCNGLSRDISHITFFGTTSAVPEPSLLVLLGTGLVGVLAVGRRLVK